MLAYGVPPYTSRPDRLLRESPAVFPQHAAGRRHLRGRPFWRSSSGGKALTGAPRKDQPTRYDLKLRSQA